MGKMVCWHTNWKAARPLILLFTPSQYLPLHLGQRQPALSSERCSASPRWSHSSSSLPPHLALPQEQPLLLPLPPADYLLCWMTTLFSFMLPLSLTTSRHSVSMSTLTPLQLQQVETWTALHITHILHLADICRMPSAYLLGVVPQTQLRWAVMVLWDHCIVGGDDTIISLQLEGQRDYGCWVAEWWTGWRGHGKESGGLSGMCMIFSHFFFTLPSSSSLPHKAYSFWGLLRQPKVIDLDIFMHCYAQSTETM